MAEKPLLIFDGKCGFCRIWIEYWKQLTGDRIEYGPSQELADQFPRIPRQSFSESVQLVMPDGEAISGARAVFTALSYARGEAWLLWLYDHAPGFAPATEFAYCFIARHRDFGYHATRLLFGRGVSPATSRKAEWVFPRALGLVYLVAFASLGMQVAGLIGSHGILPIDSYLNAISATFGARGYQLVPTVFWLNHSDMFLKAGCWIGAAVSLVLIAGFFERTALAILYALYLSYSAVGRDFLSYQWDALLLEAGFLAIFLGSSRTVVWLFRWLLFRLMFLSGAVKLLSHDETWRNLTALKFHYETQPLPTPLAWYMYQLPMSFQRVSTCMVFVFELGFPFLIFAPRRLRMFGAAGLIFLQVLIFLTGNYTFFNVLAVALCVFLFDDAALAKLRFSRRRGTNRIVAGVVAALVLLLSGLEMANTFFDYSADTGNALLHLAGPFNIVNSYGLFAVMTTTRPEIIVQGSNDGEAWLDYEFPYKAGDLKQRPKWVAPFQPRLDWQMWFAALENYQSARWFVNFMVQLLQGSPDVTGLLAKNPFAAGAPKYVRAELFLYSFTNWEERRATGQWWKREPRGLYLPAISLADVR